MGKNERIALTLLLIHINAHNRTHTKYNVNFGCWFCSNACNKFVTRLNTYRWVFFDFESAFRIRIFPLKLAYLRLLHALAKRLFRMPFLWIMIQSIDKTVVQYVCMLPFSIHFLLMGIHIHQGLLETSPEKRRL